MRVIKNKTVYQLTFFPVLFPVNCYLVEEEDSLTLVDAGLPMSCKGILKQADIIGKPITRIILTHAHGDHVGAMDALKEEFPEIKVYISKRDSRLMSGDNSLDKDEPNMPIKGGVPKNLKTTPDILLEDGDLVGSLLTIATPGHTPGSTSYMDTRNNALIVGDALQTRGGIAVAGKFVLSFPFIGMATWNKNAALESAIKLRGYKPTLLATGHGKMIVEPVADMDKAIEAAR